MILFVDPLGSEMALALARPDKTLVAESSIGISGDEFERFLDEITVFLQDSGFSLEDLTAIVCVNGPGPFTGMRVVTLTLTTLAAVRRIPAYAVNAFECFRFS